MLPVEHVARFIVHEDPLVADLALRHLEAVRRPRRLHGDFILRAAREGRPELLRRLDDFHVTPDVLHFALDELERRAAKHPKGDDDDVFWPLGVIARAPDELYTDDVARRVERLDLEPGWLRESIRLRLQMRGWTTGQLQERLERVTADSDDAGHAMSEQHEASTIVARLAERPDAREWAWEQFESARGDGWWLEIWLVSLLIKLTDRRVLDAAIERFLDIDFDENECLAEEFADAIAHVSEPPDVPRLEALFERAGDDHRRRLIGALGRIRFAEVEPLLARAARDARDDEERTDAILALCETLATSDEALALVERATDREQFDFLLCDLEESAIALGIIVGRPFEQTEAWRARLRDPERSRARERIWRERFPELKRAADLIARIGRGRRRGPTPDSYGDDPLADFVGAPEVTVAPLVRDGARVGRNEPCPCGSGKKYKKCCLNKSSESGVQV